MRSPKISIFARKRNALVTMCMPLFYRRKPERVNIEKIFVGQQAGFPLRRWIELTGEHERQSLPLKDSPYVSFIKEIREDEKILQDDEYLESTTYFKMAGICIAATGHFMETRNNGQLKAWMRQYYSMFKDIENGSKQRNSFSYMEGHSTDNSPITLRRLYDLDRYEVIDGHHRLAIYYLLERSNVVVTVLTKKSLDSK